MRTSIKRNCHGDDDDDVIFDDDGDDNDDVNNFDNDDDDYNDDVNKVMANLMAMSNIKLFFLIFQGRKLIVIGTTSCRDVLETMGIVESFNTVIHVPSLSSTDQLREVLQVSLRNICLHMCYS